MKKNLIEAITSVKRCQLPLGEALEVYLQKLEDFSLGGRIDLSQGPSEELRLKAFNKLIAEGKNLGVKLAYAGLGAEDRIFLTHLSDMVESLSPDTRHTPS